MRADLSHWLEGQLSGSERIVSSIAPALLLIAYFGIAALVYAWRGPFRDEELDKRGDGGITARSLKHFFAWTMRPWCDLLVSVRFPPNAITSLSFAVALGAGVGVASGRFALGGWLFVVAGILDFLDGRVARGTGRTTPGGAALDSVLDRYVESALIGGLAWYYRHDWVLAVCLVALTGSLLVPYVRARGESLGVQMKDVGFMQRPERVLLLGAGTALSPIAEVIFVPDDPHPPHRLAIGALLVLAVTSHATALQRLRGLMRELSGARSVRPYVAQSLKTALANTIATLADFATAGALVYALDGHAPGATVVGCCVGAVISFLLARVWAFEARGAWLPQIGRYAFVSFAGAMLNGGGVALLFLLDTPFVVAWLITRAVVFATWSYPLQRDFVFARGVA
jgi:phosphatidylglycerophosphate synthase/putative flippase GtrA